MRTVVFDDTEWQLVPKEVTPEMQAAYDCALRAAVKRQAAMVRETGSHGIQGWKSAYRAMLAAAPTPNAKLRGASQLAGAASRSNAELGEED